MDVSIVIVHYNTPEFTKRCIESIGRHTSGVAYEIIVVDNASTVHDAQELKEQFPQINLIRSRENLGFAKGNNLGIQYAGGKYILLLNSDAYLKENSVLKTFLYMEEKPKVGVVTARLVFPDGRVQSACQRFPNVKYTLLELLRVQKFLPKNKAGRLLLGAFFDNKETVSADWVWGTYFMFRKEILSLLPGNKLDDSYFMYGEDMQWCWDIKKLGYKIHLYAGTEIVHEMGGSKANKNELISQNLKRFKQKNLSPIHRVSLNFFEKLL